MRRATPDAVVTSLVGHLNGLLQFPRNNEILAKVIFNSCSPAAVTQLLRVLERIHDGSFPNPGVIVDMLQHLIASVNTLNNGDTHLIGSAANDVSALTFLAEAAERVKNRIAAIMLVEKNVYKVNPQGTVVEIYTIANVGKFYAVLDTIDNRCPEIKRLVFCSDCRTMKKRVANRYAVFSNIFRFYYCHITKLPTDVYSADRFWECTLLARLFMDNDNLSVSNPDSFTPLTAVTASNPHTNLKKFSKLLTPITPYSKHVLGQQSDELEMHSSLSTYTTVATPGFEHKTHQLSFDRDFVLFNDGPMGGGRSVHEIVIRDDQMDFGQDE